MNIEKSNKKAKKANDKKLIKKYYTNLLISNGFDKPKKSLIKKCLRYVSKNVLNFHADTNNVSTILDKLFLEKANKIKIK